MEHQGHLLHQQLLSRYNQLVLFRQERLLSRHQQALVLHTVLTEQITRLEQHSLAWHLAIMM
jgi:hypothetical protein